MTVCLDWRWEYLSSNQGQQTNSAIGDPSMSAKVSLLSHFLRQYGSQTKRSTGTAYRFGLRSHLLSRHDGH